MNTIKRILPLCNKDLIDTTTETLHKNIILISCYINKAFDKILDKDNIANEEESYIDLEDHSYDIININIDSPEIKINENDYELTEIKILS